MKVYTCKGFEGHYPVGTSAVIVGKDYDECRWLLHKALLQAGLKEQAVFMEELDLTTPKAIILNDGDY